MFFDEQITCPPPYPQGYFKAYADIDASVEVSALLSLIVSTK